MKLHRYSILSIVAVMLTAMSFSISSPTLMDNTLETKVEVLLEEEKKTETKLDENLITGISELHIKEAKVFTAYAFSLPLVNQLYLNTIFKPPKFS